jgi:hypothetical protein
MITVSIQMSLQSSDNKIVDQTNPLAVQLTETIAAMNKQTVALVLATDTALSFPGLSIPRYFTIANVGDNPVDLGPDNAAAILPLSTLEPGDSAVWPLKVGVTLRALSALGTSIQFTAYDK